MADDDYDDDYYEDGDNYIWVEDGYDLADDLAELVVPDPPFDTGEFEWDDLTRFEFWYDIEYDSDGYHDQNISRRKKRVTTQKTTATQGKKRKALDDVGAESKRMKRDGHTSDISSLPPVLFLPTDPISHENDVDPDKLGVFTILPDWRERFKDIDRLFIRRSLETPETDKETQPLAEPGEPENESHPDSAEMEGLKMALQANLSSLGLDSMKIDQSTLLRLAASMMAQSDEAEELMAELIKGVHAEEERDEEPDSFSNWVANSATTAANEKYEDLEETETDDNIDPIDPVDSNERKQSKTLPSIPRSVISSGPRGRKRRADSPNDSKPNKRKPVLDEVSA